MLETGRIFHKYNTMREKGKGYPEPKGHRLRRYLGITALAGKRQDIITWYRSVYTGASSDYMRGGR
jgi:hypothetical protein|tara:strand:- start:203 stop:400 length:198 start_codon:yes stop_codon:yes gene_type:complete